MTHDFPETLHQFSVFGENENWRYHPDYGVAEVEIGAAGKRWESAGAVYNFLRTAVTDARQLADVSAAWLDSRRPLAQQLVKLASDAAPLEKFASTDSSELLAILQERRIETWFQPVIEAGTLNVWGYECLMRGRRPDGALVSAPQLLEWAERENLKFMLDRVCRETHLLNAGQLNFGADVRFLINFLPTAIYNPQYCLQTSLAAMRRSGLEPRQIIFEVVESEKVIDTLHLLRILKFYRDSGFGVALDDMGSGYAGLTLLADLNPDLIKIDREIVSKAPHSASHRNVCASLIRMGHDNGQLVLAEGVETSAEAALMKSLGVDLFQGYYFGRPAPLEMAPAIAPRHQSIETFV